MREIAKQHSVSALDLAATQAAMRGGLNVSPGRLGQGRLGSRARSGAQLEEGLEAGQA